ncbi:putative gustatory receptor 59b [Drosophila sulfurigaster albostrigata]|uniref:putative gustatory receptor 59b n=1 Tax=Drosophila sulfurigaster albostrigata TaxID=89887 RepID=UPI002D21EA82|nr:putative gustatory receptor 59b [Drosophila sulfurigaster albostrigata]
MKVSLCGAYLVSFRRPLKMGKLQLLQWYHNYALVLGVTSHRLVSGRVQQSWVTRWYTVVANVFILIALPGMFWLSVEYIRQTNWFPNLIPFTSYILYSVSYAAISYTILSRSWRDCALVELESIVCKINSQHPHHVDRCLEYIFYLKLATMILLTLIGMVMCLMIPNEHRWNILLITFVFQNAMNIPPVATYRYFLALWYIASSYQSINRRLNELVNAFESRLPKRGEREELFRLWSMHAVLGRCTLKINKVYEFLMLAARFEFATFCVIYGYWGMLFAFAVDTPIYAIMFGCFNYWIRFLDFYLLDAMCDLTIHYQNNSYHGVTEGHWFKELNYYLLYTKSSKFEISVCGLYTVNRSRWFQMLGSLTTFTLLLLQFHLILKDKFTL